ncbi:MAG TPA: tetratricopeptide repeat protein [Gammaproteobacteria bacterium]|nr:tetratricopeptide repeat protein [Gammaproteobacteria bacterium]
MKSLKTLLTFAFFALPSCSISQGPVKINTYAGINPSIENIGLLKCTQSVKIISIDGNKKYSVDSSSGSKFQGCEIRLLPGEHTINLCHEIFYDHDDGLLGMVGIDINNEEILGCKPQNISFNITADHIYKIETQITREYGTSLGVRKNVSVNAGKISIIDVTESEKLSVYYNLAKEQNVLAKNAQNENRWAASLTHWSKALKYAEKGKIGLDKIAKIQFQLGRSLATACKYDEALENLKKSYAYYNEHTEYAYRPLISIANIYYEQNKCSSSLDTYTNILDNYKSNIEKYDHDILKSLQSNVLIIKSSSTCDKETRPLNYQVPYGSQC